MFSSFDSISSVSQQKLETYEKEALAWRSNPHSSMRQNLAKNLRQWADKLEPQTSIQKTKVYS